MEEKHLPSYRSAVDDNFKWDEQGNQTPQTPPVTGENVPDTGIPSNAFDNPVEGPTHTGTPTVPQSGK